MNHDSLDMVPFSLLAKVSQPGEIFERVSLVFGNDGGVYTRPE
jgi:hypothetical protein